MVLEGDETFFKATGYSAAELRQQAWIDLLFPGELRPAARAFYQALRAGDVSAYELALVRKDGARAVFEVSTANDYQKDGRLEKIAGVGIDITERKRIEEASSRKEAERALRESEERYRLVLESVKDYAIFTLDPEGYITSWNPGAEKIKGYTKDEILGQHFSLFYPPEDTQRNVPQQALARAIAEGRMEMEGWRIRKGGQRFWASVVITPMLDSNGRLRGFCKVVRDMSRRKLMEAEMAELQRRLMDGREAERLQLARELHDGPVQDLYGISFRFKAFYEAFPEGGDKEAAQAIQDGIHRVTRTLRQITSELRPPTLAPLGLEKAIRSHAEVFRETFPNLEIVLDLEPDGQKLPMMTRLALFRIYQNALANVLRHSHASQVKIRLALELDQVLLEVQDNGEGFSVPARWIEMAREGRLGLAGAAERAQAIGGRFTVESTPGKGSCVRVVVPHAAFEKMEV